MKIIKFLTLYLITLTLAAPAALAAPTFTRRDYPLGQRQYPVRLVGGADLTSDGLADLVAMTDTGGVCVLARRSDGSFAVNIVANDATFPYAVALGDFNADGRGDIVYAITDGLRVLLQTAGGFSPGVFIGTGVGGTRELVESLVVGDFNGDGRADIAAVDNDEVNTGMPAAHAIAAYGIGNGTFDTSRGGIALSEWPRKLFGIDANADGRPELFAGFAIARMGIARYDTAASAFIYSQLATLGSDAIADASPGDINGDAKTDIALLLDGRTMEWTRIRVANNDACPLCHPAAPCAGPA